VLNFVKENLCTSDIIFFNSGALPNILHYITLQLLQQRKELDSVRLQQQQARNPDRNVPWFSGTGEASFVNPAGYSQLGTVGNGWYPWSSTGSVPNVDVTDSAEQDRRGQESSADRARFKQRAGKDTCRKCGVKGHWARECPARKAANEGVAPSEAKLMVTSDDSSRRSADVHLPVTIRGKRTLAFLDTGCETSVIGRLLVPDVDLEPTSNRLFAANGTVIPLLGRLEVDLSVSRRRILARLVVSEAVHELILRIDFLTSHQCRWQFSSGND